METFEYIILTVANHSDSNKNEIESHCSNYIDEARHNNDYTKCVLKFPKRVDVPTCMSSLTRYNAAEIKNELTADEWTIPIFTSETSASFAALFAAELIIERNNNSI